MKSSKLGEIPILELLVNPVYSFSRTHPLYIILIFAVAFLLTGLLVEFLRIMAWIGIVMIGIYFLYVVIWFGFKKLR